MAPEELPDYARLTPCRVIDYTPEWKRREDEKPPPLGETEKKRSRQQESSQEAADAALDLTESKPGRDILYSLPDLTGEDAYELGMVEITQVRGDKERDEDRDIPPRH